MKLDASNSWGVSRGGYPDRLSVVRGTVREFPEQGLHADKIPQENELKSISAFELSLALRINAGARSICFIGCGGPVAAFASVS